MVALLLLKKGSKNMMMSDLNEQDAKSVEEAKTTHSGSVEIEEMNIGSKLSDDSK